MAALLGVEDHTAQFLGDVKLLDASGRLLHCVALPHGVPGRSGQ